MADMTASTELEGKRQPLSGLLADLADRPEPRISVEVLIECFGQRALGGLLLIFGLLCALPLPPGATTIFGLPILLLAPQMAIGKGAPWLPGRLRRQSVSTADFRRGLPRVMPWLKRLEAVSRPRWHVFFGASGQRLAGVVCAVLGLVLILPIPLGNMLPAATVSVLAFSFVQRDGVLALAGYVLAASSLGVLVLAAGAIVGALHHLLAVFSFA